MFLINFQLWARIRKIPGGGSFNIRGGGRVIKRGKGLGFRDSGLLVKGFRV